MVCWNGSHAEKGGSYQDLCRPENENVLCEVHPLLKVDKTWHDSQEPQFSVNWMQKVDFGRYTCQEIAVPHYLHHSGQYCFQKMPFGISSAPEHFQKRMTEVLSGLNGVLCLMDDVLVL